jgi:signal peptidase I
MVVPAAVAETAEGAEVTESSHTSVRQLLEALICLAMAVIFFRAFVLEGYIISTGSMAPSLLGYHKRVQCPDCGFSFAFGVSTERPRSASSLVATCPNCRLSTIDVSNVPRNDGDQLLVLKNAWLAELSRWLRIGGPKRWDVVVFLNPNDPSQAYVKRAIGLPGEAVQIRDGDIFVDGERQRKSMPVQRAIRIPVFDNDFPSRSKDWVPRWIDETGRWQPVGNGFVASGNAASPGASERRPDEPSFAWLRYHNWLRPAPRRSPGRVSPERVGQHAATLEVQPILDRYGYNRLEADHDRVVTHDLMLTAQLDWNSGTGGIAARIKNRGDEVVCLLDPAGRELSVFCLPDMHSVNLETLLAERLRGETRPKLMIAEASLWAEWPLEFEFSVFDRQVTVAVNGRVLVQEPLPESVETIDPMVPVAAYRPPTIAVAGHSGEGIPAMQGPDGSAAGGAASIGVFNGTARVNSLRLFRDVHYTAEAGQHATSRPLSLGDDEFFMLGDNSPVSLDSRGWLDPVVPRRLLIGRPLVVHLPSRPGRLRIGDRVSHIRVPDFSRMRYIR